MESLFAHKEISPMHTKSIWDCIHKPSPHKAALLAFLRGEAHKRPGGFPELLKNVLEDTYFAAVHYYDDGTYAWRTDIIYYFDKYDLELPDAFVQHVLAQVSA
ncbi:MAG: hypothetical protein LBN26_01290 [Christensenellaceae bacterium]|jgi:hypothetical protein|nr:hypothetical protein [Christensenellaceae bacterium]